MSPLTAAQQAFLDQMSFNNVDERALRVMRAAFIHRNNDALRTASSVDFADELDKVAS